MKVAVAFIVVLCVVVVCSGFEENSISNDELKELIDDYKNLYKEPEDGKTAPIREMAVKTKELTLKYFKTVGLELARHMCNSLDDIVKSFSNKNDDNNEI